MEHEVRKNKQFIRTKYYMIYNFFIILIFWKTGNIPNQESR